MKINRNLARILLIFLLFIIITVPLVHAAETINTSDYDPILYSTPQDTKTILNIGGKLWGILSAVGVIVSVIALAIIGLRTVFGSVEDKAAYKKAMMPYIIGLCMVAGISGITNLVYNFSESTITKSYCKYCGLPYDGIYNHYTCNPMYSSVSYCRQCGTRLQSGKCPECD